MPESDADRPAIDALLPDAMARKAEAAGVAKAQRDPVRLFALAVLAGAFIAFGALFSTIVGAGAGELPYGVGRLLVGLVFALGLILVVVGGAELFTGDVLMVMAWASRRLRLAAMLRAWAIIYVGNFIGACGTAVLVFLSGQYRFGGGAVGAAALALAGAKLRLPFWDALMLGVLCNVLVCLAVWASLSARSVTDKVAILILPVAAFVAAGFEHSIANMYVIPLGLMIDAAAPDAFWAALGRVSEGLGVAALADFARNLVAVTIGNMIGGGVLVAAVYWFIYLREVPPPQR